MLGLALAMALQQHHKELSDWENELLRGLVNWRWHNYWVILALGCVITHCIKLLNPWLLHCQQD